MYSRIRILFILTLFVVSANAVTYNINTQSGLSNNFVHSIFKDSQGLLWIGTETGLDSYDGLQIVSYAKRFKTPLKGAVQSIVEINNGKYLIGTSWGAFLFDVKQNGVNPVNYGFAGIDVRSIIKTSKGNFYSATDKGLFLLDIHTLKAKLISLDNGKEPSLNALVEGENETLFIVGEETVYELLPDNKIKNISTKIPSTHLNTARLIDSTLYLGTTQGLLTLHIKTHESKLVKSFRNQSILSFSSNKSVLFIGTENDGIYEYRTKTGVIRHFQKSEDRSENLTSNTIYALLYDESNGLWSGSFNEGVDFVNLLEKKRFQTFDLGNTTHNYIRSINFDSSDNKYIGTRDGVIYILNKNNALIKQINAYAENKIRSKIILSIKPYPGKPDLLLIGTFGGGAYVFDTKSNRFANFPEGTISKTAVVYQFCFDGDQNLWFATFDGLIKYDLGTNTATKYDVSEIMGSNDIFTLACDAKKNIWLGAKTGLCYFDSKQNKIIQPAILKSFPYQCTSVYADKENNIWACFNKGGVLKLDANLNEKLWLTDELGLPENSPSSLIEDKNKNIWIGSSKGLFKVNPNNEVHSFGLEDGLTSLGFCPEAATLDAEAKLWWSTNNGLVTYNDDISTLNNLVPKLKLTNLLINGILFDTDTLAYVSTIAKDKYAIKIHGKSNNNLQFGVAALNYKYPTKNRYKFYLENVDNGREKSTTNNFVKYTDLDPGSYTLKISAANNDGIWTTVPTEIQFSIIPYFYETVWFKAVLWLVLITLGLFFIRKYILRLKSGIQSQLQELKNKQNQPPTLKIADERVDLIKEKLLAYMSDEKPFLNADLRQADVAKSIGFTIHEISNVLNSRLNMNFSDFVNSFRIEEVKARMKTEDSKKFTLAALAMQCGFNAKSSFLRAFKKATGMTPTEYFKEIKEL